MRSETAAASEHHATTTLSRRSLDTDVNKARDLLDPLDDASAHGNNGATPLGTLASATSGEALAGRRLPGLDAKIVRIPPQFRYRLTTKFPAASAVVRRWEAASTQQGLLEARVFLARECGYPLATFTVLKYNGNERSAVRKRLMSLGNIEPMSYDWRGKSYYRLLHSTWAPCDKDRDSQDDHPTAAQYMPNFLDDPEFRQGRHRHVVRGDKNIGPVVSSTLLFVKPNELKEVWHRGDQCVA
ncbi:hypothetical protein PINS_up006998 [Pythium insidiosum]|nr:hypothetical protein PINS_up006998 [Pythium insidiosum]